MSNKKRIRTRIAHLEYKKYSKIHFKLIARAGERSVSALNGIAKVLSEFRETIHREIYKFEDYCLGAEFVVFQLNPEFEEFALDIRKLTALSEKEVNQKCLFLAKEYWETLKGLLIAGFKLDEAINEIVETYRL